MYDKLTEIESLLKNNNINEALIKINSLKEEFNKNKENTSVTNNQEQVIKKEDVDKKIKEFQEKDKLTEPIIFEFLKTNYDKYIASEDRINRLNNFDINQTNQDIKPQNLMPDFIKKQLGNM